MLVEKFRMVARGLLQKKKSVNCLIWLTERKTNVFLACIFVEKQWLKSSHARFRCSPRVRLDQSDWTIRKSCEIKRFICYFKCHYLEKIACTCTDGKDLWRIQRDWQKCCVQQNCCSVKHLPQKLMNCPPSQQTNCKKKFYERLLSFGRLYESLTMQRILVDQKGNYTLFPPRGWPSYCHPLWSVQLYCFLARQSAMLATKAPQIGSFSSFCLQQNIHMQLTRTCAGLFSLLGYHTLLSISCFLISGLNETYNWLTLPNSGLAACRYCDFCSKCRLSFLVAIRNAVLRNVQK